MSEELLDLAIATTSGHELWSTLRGLRIDISIGGPIWAMKGWPPEKTFDQRRARAERIGDAVRCFGCGRPALLGSGRLALAGASGPEGAVREG